MLIRDEKQKKTMFTVDTNSLECFDQAKLHTCTKKKKSRNEYFSMGKYSYRPS